MPPRKKYPVGRNTESPRCVFSFNRVTCEPSAISVLLESTDWLISVEVNVSPSVKLTYNVKVLPSVTLHHIRKPKPNYLTMTFSFVIKNMLRNNTTTPPAQFLSITLYLKSRPFKVQHLKWHLQSSVSTKVQSSNLVFFQSPPFKYTNTSGWVQVCTAVRLS